MRDIQFEALARLDVAEQSGQSQNKYRWACVSAAQESLRRLSHLH
jgi:hypothetical protein